MAHMMRKQVYIGQGHERILKRLARERGVTEAEIIRSAIEREGKSFSDVAQYPDDQAWEEICAIIESLIAEGTVSGRRSWNREELYEERLRLDGR